MSKFFVYQIKGYLKTGFTLNEVSRILAIHPNTAKAIDKQQLKQKLGNMRPKSYSEYIAVDEFLLHKGHRYATVVIDLKTGKILFCQKGKKKEQIKNFFKFVGNKWMQKVKAVAMDMNAQYDSAFKESYPKIDIVYDFFHVMKYYSDMVITDLRREEQNKAYENNIRLREKYTNKGLSLPPGERIMRTGGTKKLEELLAINHKLSVSYILKEQLHEIFSYTNKEKAEDSLTQWLALATSSKIPKILKFCDTINNRWTGIINHTIHNISSGKLEGTNNMIKTTRRKSYGFRDTKYFFMKIIENSMRNRYGYKSHRFLF